MQGISSGVRAPSIEDIAIGDHEVPVLPEDRDELPAAEHEIADGAGLVRKELLIGDMSPEAAEVQRKATLSAAYRERGLSAAAIAFLFKMEEVGGDMARNVWAAMLAPEKEGAGVINVVSWNEEADGNWVLKLDGQYVASSPDGQGKTYYFAQKIKMTLSPNRIDFPGVDSHDKKIALWAVEAHAGSDFEGACQWIQYSDDQVTSHNEIGPTSWWGKAAFALIPDSLLEPQRNRVKDLDQVNAEWGAVVRVRQ